MILIDTPVEFREDVPMSSLRKLSTAMIIMHLVLKIGHRRRDKDHRDYRFSLTMLRMDALVLA
jgi:hypothetical protein